MIDISDISALIQLRCKSMKLVSTHNLQRKTKQAKNKCVSMQVGLQRATADGEAFLAGSVTPPTASQLLKKIQCLQIGWFSAQLGCF